MSSQTALLKTCPACAESSEPQFDLCWNCGSPLPESVSAVQVPHHESQTAPLTHEKKYSASTFIVFETLAIVLLAFATQILMSGGAAEPPITASTLIYDSLWWLGWILLVVRLLNIEGAFSWNLPSTLKEWSLEAWWGALLFGAAALVELRIRGLGLDWGVVSRPTYWDQALRDPATRMAFKIVAPLSAFAEEMLCRVYMQTRLTQILRGRPIFVVLIASGLFAAAHGYAPLESLVVFGSGVVLGTSYQINGRIPRLVIAHAALNLLTA